mmetsp:Transcript_8303/g.9495  ORF Transcript_8303/g.9495 Transcript_8303/m.9495 type:complete len:321 (+) Transcript_8303:223-1185(+)|eukprot:CAMPEP_0184032000 /NCGR_PEP_ID=MMETSP0955-20130417/2679_1 /TAXON_ID=627963 /ORGANISM="Aplanochytrium sp, Strain PBS07" /LENGTH=320 /DNA_ID=CAMNT_0026317911 /DNA_START=209 /DNA_END=1171 /DNA_ORIENTATION=+
MPAARRHKISKHGTLAPSDMSGAVPIQVEQVVENCQNSNLQDYFGLAGELPPSKAQDHTQKFQPFYKITDSQTGDDWIGLKKGNNKTKGIIALELPAGDYKLDLELPRTLNANFFHDFTGVVVGGIMSIVAESAKDAEARFKRGHPSAYMDVRIRVTGRKYGIVDDQSVMDLGTQSKLTRHFKVKKSEAPAKVEMLFHSYSAMKRLKVVGGISRRELSVKKSQQDMIHHEAKKIVQKALIASPEEVIADSVSKKVNSKIIDSDVDVKEMVVRFYHMFAPEKVRMTDKVLAHFEDRVDDMINAFELKYGVRFDHKGYAVKV